MEKAKKATATKTADSAAKSAASSALERAIAQIEKQYGTGSIMKMDEANIARVEGISTGALSLDIALGAGFRGRVCELFGPESSGKTTIALMPLPTQKEGGVAAFIDAEHAAQIRRGPANWAWIFPACW